MIVNIKKLVDTAVIPSYSKVGDAGMDLIATAVNQEDMYVEYCTGLSIEIPEGYAGLIFPRSSNSNTSLLLTNSIGLIDSGYRGEIRIRYRRIINPLAARVAPLDSSLRILDSTYTEYEVGNKVAQLVIMPYPSIEFNVLEDLSITERGEGGFGSSGK